MHCQNNKADSSSSAVGFRECKNAWLCSQGHDQTVPNGAKNGRLHTPSGHNNDTNHHKPQVAKVCARLAQLFIVSQKKLKQKISHKTKHRVQSFGSMNYRNKKDINSFCSAWPASNSGHQLNLFLSAVWKAVCVAPQCVCMCPAGMGVDFTHSLIWGD